MELIVANVVMIAYVCGNSVLEGCGMQFFRNDDVFDAEGKGKLLCFLCYVIECGEVKLNCFVKILLVRLFRVGCRLYQRFDSWEICVLQVVWSFRWLRRAKNQRVKIVPVFWCAC